MTTRMPPTSLRAALRRGVLTLAIVSCVVLAVAPRTVLASMAEPDDVSASMTVVRVGVYDNPPLSFLDETGTPQGVYVDVLREIGEQEGWWIDFVPGTWTGLLEGLHTGDVHVLGPIARTAERESFATFTGTPFYTNWGQLYVRPDRSDEIESLVSLDGRRVAVVRGDVYYIGPRGLRALAEEFKIDITFVEVVEYRDAFAAVRSDDVDAAAVSRSFGGARAPSYGLIETGIVFSPVESRIAVSRAAPGASELRLALDSALDEMQTDPDSVLFASIARHVRGEQPASEAPTWLRRVLLALAIGVALLLSLIYWLRRAVRARTKELAAANARLEALVEALPDAMVRLTADGMVIEYWPDPEVPLGMDPDDARGRPVTSLPLPPGVAEHISDAAIKALAGDTPERIAFTVESPSGNPRHIEARLVSTGHDIVCLMRDVTDRVSREKELESLVAERTADLTSSNRELERASRAKSDFLANMSHELRTPLNSIIGFADVLVSGLAGPLNEEQDRQISMMGVSGRHLLSLVDDVLDISRIEADRTAVKPSLFETRDLVRDAVEVVRPQADGKEITLEWDVRPDVPHEMNTDYRLLKQILLNLLSNAVKFTDTGSVTVTVERSDPLSVAFIVTDTGRGMDEAHLSHIFDKFVQLDDLTRGRPTGTGLGLSISREIARLIGGGIEVRSQRGTGSTFTVVVPIVLPADAMDTRP
jgi:PAS domain S-box-containing protein